MEQKSSDELVGGQGHRFGLIVMPIVLPLKSNLIVVDCEQSVIGDGHAMRIAAYVIQHLLWSGERALCVDHPLGSLRSGQELGKTSAVEKSFHCPEQLQLASVEGSLQRFEKKSPEQTGEYAHWQEEARPAGDPSFAVSRGATAGHDTMQVRMEMKVLSPRMEHGEEADLCSQMFRVRRDGSQSFRRATEENVVHDCLVLICNSGNLFRNGEHDVEIGNLCS